MINLTVVDQSPIQLGSEDQRPAPQLSVELAKACEEWGYKRYWLAEHHNTSYFSGPTPEILISRIASETNSMRIGSGGVMLSHYSPYKVAENFRLLATLFPGRIDMGIGRAPGGDQMASMALSYPGQATYGEVYSRQAHDLKAFLDGGLEEAHPFKSLITSPYDDYSPEYWMLGTSGGSAALAGHLGYSLSLGLFVAPTGQKYDIVESYLQAFENAEHKHKPEVMIAVGGACADTKEEAEYIVSSQLYKKTIAQTRGDDNPWIHPDQVQDNIKGFSAREHRYYNLLKENFVIGTPAECEERMMKLQEYWRTDEFAFLTVTHSFESRKNSYKLLAKQLL
ncbi:MAG: MsnO8 family LLM class oxidoreductase [Kordiimonadaceae bacterium]|jgi:luciferase family oxidoreductase group 1|nr:MsnO8 family LLM class oxidoreductase [Kordiimonadaceae bacterium]